MRKKYILNNSLDTSLFHLDGQIDTRSIRDAKSFSSRSLAERYLEKRNLSENYRVRLSPTREVSRVINESITDDEIKKEIDSAVEDIYDMISTTIDLVSMYSDGLDSDGSRKGSLDNLADKLRKMKKYSSGISYSPSFDNSLGSSDFELSE